MANSNLSFAQQKDAPQLPESGALDIKCISNDPEVGGENDFYIHAIVPANIRHKSKEGYVKDYVASFKYHLKVDTVLPPVDGIIKNASGHYMYNGVGSELLMFSNPGYTMDSKEIDLLPTGSKIVSWSDFPKKDDVDSFVFYFSRTTSEESAPYSLPHKYTQNILSGFIGNSKTKVFTFGQWGIYCTLSAVK